MTPARKLLISKWLVFVGLLLPFINIVIKTIQQDLGADPQQTIIRLTGEWSFIALMLTLTISPLQRRTSFKWIIGVRRMVGLYVFFYATVHLTSFTLFYLGGSLSLLTEDIIKRPYIIVGFIAWLLLLALAVTSPNRIHRMLKKTWQKLHNSIYAIALLSCLHYLWLVKSDLNKPVGFTLIIVFLLTERFLYFMKKPSRVSRK